MKKPFLLSIILATIAQIPNAQAETSVSQFGITWTFSQDKTVGRFANGDWWVVGPVTITQISPAPAVVSGGYDTNGTMINPVWSASDPRQGWDARIRNYTYDGSKNIAKSLPYTVATGSSVMTSSCYAAWIAGNEPQMETMAILTVLPSAPPAGSFRPPYVAGVSKAVRWNKSQLLYSRLKKLPIVPNTPDFPSIEAYFERPHIALTPGWTTDYLLPRLNDYPNYGREISHKAAAGGLLLQLNYTDAQKETLLVRMVQRGIDIYGIRAAGGGWWADGGHGHGRKLPMVLAGWVLNEPEIMSKTAGIVFAEDAQHFYVSQADVDQPRLQYEGQRRDPFTVAMIGTPEWGGNHAGSPQGDGSNWDLIYRQLVGRSTIGDVLAARIMGAQSVWNHPATFDYYDRFWNYEKSFVGYGTNDIQPFVSEMWKAYRNADPGTPTTNPPSAPTGLRVVPK